MEETRNAWENEELLNIVTVGHVDHGKSTVIGRLLADAGALPKGKLESIRENCRRNSKPFEYAFLLDALHNEQDQGITIDTARCFFKSDKRRYIIIDAPGHIEFLKNMVTGASRAEAALMVIDAARGVEENTRRHGYFLSMLGIRQVAVLVNKMDLVGYSEEVYRSIVTEFTEFLAKINISPAAFIPVSGMEGDNIAIRSERTPWYFGPTVLEQMDAFVPVPSPENRPLRMPVQGVYKFTEGGDERRTVAVDGGHVGDLGGQAAVNPYRAAAVLVHDGHLRAVSESAFAAAFQADDLFDERPCADVVVADAGVADAHARCEPDTAAQPCAAQLRGVKVLRHLDRRPVVGRRAGGFERGDFAGGQSSVCVHSRHISNLQI